MKPEEFHVRQDQNHMATTFELIICCETKDLVLAEQTLDEAHILIESLERELSEFLGSSPVYRLNHSAPGKIISLPPSTASLMQKSFTIATLTQNAFNPLAKSAKAGTVHYSLETQTALRSDSNTHLSFGAIGKGFALDQVSTLLDKRGFKNYLLSAGGSSIVLSGFAGEGIPWDWAWSWKKDSDGSALGVPFTHVQGSKIALGISGTHEQGDHLIDANGKRTAHMKSALVAHNHAAEADALSTALFVSGWTNSSNFLKESDVRGAAIIDASEVPHWSHGFQAQWGSIAAKTLVIFTGMVFWVSRAMAASADDSVDLSSLEGSSFTPYVIERDSRWIILPLFMLAFSLLHLIQFRRKNFKTKVKETP
jgi:thiamine biosynthesis lipoprotein ApbE